MAKINKNYVVKLSNIEEYEEFKEKFNFQDTNIKGFSFGLEGEFVFYVEIFDRQFYFFNDDWHLKYCQEFIENKINLTIEEAKTILLN